MDWDFLVAWFYFIVGYMLAKARFMDAITNLVIHEANKLRAYQKKRREEHEKHIFLVDIKTGKDEP